MIFVTLTFVPQLPSDATRPLEEEDFSPQVRDVSLSREHCHSCIHNTDCLVCVKNTVHFLSFTYETAGHALLQTQRCVEQMLEIS